MPLNGNLENQGLDGNTTVVTTTNASFVNNGKIGKCLKLGYTNNITVPSLVGAKQMSWAYWCRVDEATAANWYDPIHWYSAKADGSDSYISRQEFYTNCTNTGVWYKGGAIGKGSFGNITVGEWIHFAFTIDYSTGIAIFYINGEEVSRSSTVDTTHQIAAAHMIRLGENGLSISENDVRIYDEILSPKVIKEISKGLVLHYTLAMPGGTNIVKQSSIWRNGSCASGITSSVLSDGTYQVVASSGNNNWNSGWFSTLDGIEDSFAEGDEFTISFTIKSDNNTKLPTIYIKSGMGYYSMIGKVSSQWSTIYYTGTWKKANTLAPHLGWGGIVGTYQFKNWKLEKGNKLTPWIPHVNDTEYTQMGLNNNIEYDVSGYCHNGTKSGTITYDVDTPRYWTSSKFSSSDISTDPLPSSVITISFWYKPLSGSSYIVFADTGTGLCFGRENDHINTGISAAARADTISSSGFANNSWYHIVIVKKSNTGRDVYVNGQKVDIVGNNYWTNDIAGLFIGKRKASNTSISPYYLNGNIVDFRAYVTAFNEADILALYNTPISLTSSGVLMTSGELTGV